MKRLFASIFAAGLFVAPALAQSVLLRCSDRTYSLPGTPYMHKIRPSDSAATVEAIRLPEGLRWNERRRLVEGRIDTEGDYSYGIVVNGIDTVPVHLTVSSALPMPTPMMGWLSWNTVMENVSASAVYEVADAFADKGLREAGYRWLGIDDDWHSGRERPADGIAAPDPVRFPDGMKAVGDYLHDRGFKFGIYSTAADLTCDSKYGSYRYEDADARKYAEWGVDFLKYDYCFVPELHLGKGVSEDPETALYLYGRMADALKRTGRPIVLYMCEWGSTEPWRWAHKVGAPLWRSTHDHRDGWMGRHLQEDIHRHGIGVWQALKIWPEFWSYTGVNHFNDADMLCIGIRGRGVSSSILLDGVSRRKEDGMFLKDGKQYFGMSTDEAHTEFVMWCMWSSPLMLSLDARDSIAPEDLAVITNPELIAINQDPMGQCAEYMGETGGVQLWVKDLANGDVAVAAVNLNDEPADYTIDLASIDALDPEASYKARNPLDRVDLPDMKGSAKVSIPTHGVKVMRLSKK
ncbi:MAG: glycoside hydrolase family 27 protein [Muribaculaceae bacterium]|nr:glycoside hydrolase family 27 protein [Muribaculaceae bacterium]